MTTKTVAIFIDADNVAHNNIDMIMAQMQEMGTIIIKRIYGNWTKPILSGWAGVVVSHGLTAIQQFDHISGKNASDIAICLDVMEVLYTKNIDIFCLVSSDSDFTSVCLKLREHGKYVIGMGNLNTSKALVAACHEFKFFNKEIPAPALVQNTTTSTPKFKNKDPNDDAQLLAIIKNAIATQGTNGRLAVANLGSVLHDKGFAHITHKYGFDKLTSLINTLRDYETTTIDSTVYIQKREPKVIAPAYSINDTPTIIDKMSADAIQKDATLTNAISNAIAFYKNDKGWASVGSVANHVRNEFGIVANQYGYKTMSEVLENLFMFELKKISKEDGTRVDMVKDNRLDELEPALPKSNAQDDTLKKLAENSEQIKLMVDEIFVKYQDPQGWVMLSTLGQELRDHGISAKNFGYKNIGLLLKDLGDYEHKTIGTTAYIKDPNLAKQAKKHPKESTQPPIQESLNQESWDNTPTDNQPTNITENTADTASLIDQTDDTHLTKDDDVCTDNTDDSLNNTADDTQEDDSFGLADLLAIINDAIAHYANDDGYAKVGDIGKYVRSQIGLGSQSFGFNTFGDMLANLNGYQVQRFGRFVMVKHIHA